MCNRLRTPRNPQVLLLILLSMEEPWEPHSCQSLQGGHRLPHLVGSRSREDKDSRRFVLTATVPSGFQPCGFLCLWALERGKQLPLNDLWTQWSNRCHF